jgi:hypothetical protein
LRTKERAHKMRDRASLKKASTVPVYTRIRVARWPICGFSLENVSLRYDPAPQSYQPALTIAALCSTQRNVYLRKLTINYLTCRKPARSFPLHAALRSSPHPLQCCLWPPSLVEQELNSLETSCDKMERCRGKIEII